MLRNYCQIPMSNLSSSKKSPYILYFAIKTWSRYIATIIC